MIRRRSYLSLLGTGLFGGLSLGGTRLVRAKRGPQEQTVTEETKLTPNDGRTNHLFGESAAVHEGTAVIGAFAADTPTADAAGAAYVFEDDSGTWRQQAKLTATDADEGDQFGRSLSMGTDEPRVLVGAPKSTANQGAAYVFEQDAGEWTQQGKLTAVDGDAGGRFGRAISLGQERALVGAPQEEVANEYGVGAAYVFERGSDGWTQQTRFVADAVDANDNFGTSVELEGDTALVGLTPAETGAEPTGEQRVLRAAYVFGREDDGWTQRAELGIEGSDLAGTTVDLHGDSAIVGAPDIDTAFVFERDSDGWKQQAALTDGNDEWGDRFSESVELDGNTAVVGAPRDEEPNGRLSGSAYVFERGAGGWTQGAKVAASDGTEDENFGRAVAVSNRTVLVGVPWDDPNGDNAGSVYLYRKQKHGTGSNTEQPVRETASEQGNILDRGTDSGSSPGGEFTGEDGQGLGTVSALVGLGGVGYLLQRRLQGGERN